MMDGFKDADYNRDHPRDLPELAIANPASCRPSACRF
jgi:hypothetical protein